MFSCMEALVEPLEGAKNTRKKDARRRRGLGGSGSPADGSCFAVSFCGLLQRSSLSSVLSPPPSLSPPARPGKKGLRRARLRVAKNYVADTTVQLHDHTEDQE